MPRSNAKLPFTYFLNLPHKNSDSAISWYQGEIATLKQSLEECFGAAITRENLVSAIKTYNETRMLLRELYDLRKSENSTSLIAVRQILIQIG